MRTYYPNTYWRWVDFKGEFPNSLTVRRHINILEGKTQEEIKSFWDKRDEDYRKRQEARSNRGGWRLTVYFWEHQTYPEFQKVPVTRTDVQKYLNKLVRHFKTSKVTFSHELRRGGGGVYHPGYFPYIRMGKEPTLGIVCHEFAHHLTRHRYPTIKKWHGKHFKKELKRVYTFAKRYLPKEKTPFASHFI